MVDPRELLRAGYWREHRLAFAYAAFALVMFVVFVIATFPYARALTVALQPLHLRVTYGEQHSGFPIGAVLEDVRLLETGRLGPALFQSDQLSLKPGLGVLIGRPSLSVSANAYGGQAALSLSRASGLAQVGFDLTDIDLGRYPMPHAVPVKIAGIASALGHLEINGRGISQTGSANLVIRQLALSLSSAMPELKFNDLQGKFRVNHGILQIDHLAGAGPDLKVDIDGTVHLMPTAAQTTVNLTAAIHPTAAGRAHLRFYLNFLPHPPDSRPYHIRGPLLAPALS